MLFNDLKIIKTATLDISGPPMAITDSKLSVMRLNGVMFSIWILILMSSIQADLTVAADIYRWTDEAGVTHISDQPPPAGTRNDAVRVTKMPGKEGQPSPSEKRESPDIVVPFQRAYGGMLVQVVLNDHLSARMLVDTGATTVKINVNLLKQLNQDLPANPRTGKAMTAAGVVEAKEVFLEKIDLGGAVKHNVQASFTDESHDNPNYDGLLGLSFLSDFRMTIDYEKNLIYLRLR